MAWYEKIDEISDSLIKLDQKLGVKKIIQYLVILLLFIGVINIKSVLRWGVEFVTELNEEIHTEKMEKRDQLLAELVPELHELQGATGADRVLYFEYHNSKENVVGIPFKYIDLVLQSSRYGVPLAPISKFRDINVGNLTPLYEEIKEKRIIPCRTSEVEEFARKFPGNHEFLCENDGSVQQVFITIPGIRQPIGMIILEWMDDDEIDMRRVYRESATMVSSINGLILKYM
jgi:hypothetical protein